ncbi:MAG: hypothetical protein GY939_11435 [Actinomycetia bacterium]|nr:hypothetical protein [Actinomycetes bacterium]
MVLCAFTLFTAACSDTDSASGDLGNDGAPDTPEIDGDENGGSGNGSDGSEDNSGATDGPDNDDAAEIVGNPDLDLDEAGEAGELLDDIDDFVSIGDCQSEPTGLAMTAPDGWACRVLDQPAGGLDGFTLFTEGNALNITIGTPSGFPAPCEVFNACDEAVAIDLSDNFPDTMQWEIAGTVSIWGTYKDSDAEMVITNPQPLTNDEITFISMVLDSVVTFP